MICNKTSVSEGTNQLQRPNAFLAEDYVRIDERSQADLLHFVHGLSKQVHLYTPNNQTNGTWQEVLGSLSAFSDPGIPDQRDTPSHIALLWVFTKLYARAQDILNAQGAKHLDYYYRQVLKITGKVAVPDRINLVLELAKSRLFDRIVVKSGTGFDGGLDANGIPLVYRTEKEATISRVTIAQLKTLYRDQDQGFKRFMAAPTADSSDGIGSPLSEAVPFWPPFGAPQLSRDQSDRNMVDARLGFAVRSPILLLREGTRELTVNCYFFADAAFALSKTLSGAFKLRYSSTVGWMEPEWHTTQLIQRGSSLDGFGHDWPTSVLGLPGTEPWRLEIRVGISQGQPEFCNLDSQVLTDGYASGAPVLECILQPESLGYDTLVQLKLDLIRIRVEADGMKDHLLQSNSGVLNPNSPFAPFGSQPAAGNSLVIGNKEVFHKKLENLTLDLLWHDVPEPQFLDYYDAYEPNPGFNNNTFNVRISMLLNRSWSHQLKAPVSLFNELDATLPQSVEVTQADFDGATGTTSYVPEPAPEVFSPLGTTTQRGFIRLELLPHTQPFRAFGHREFPNVYAQAAIGLATGVIPPPELPNPPYTPMLGGLILGYSSSKELKVGTLEAEDAIYQLGPFGFRNVERLSPSLVPKITEEGALFLGLENLTSPQSLNFLFQVEAGTSDRDALLREEQLFWSYLRQDQWVTLGPSQVLADGTRAFKTSGIVSLVLPSDANNDNRYLPTGYYWLKASVSEGATGAQQVRRIWPNAVEAVLDIGKRNFDTHLQTPLEPGTVTGMVQRLKEIKKIEQPLRSFGGIPTENSTAFGVRVSERLRHKNRSVQHWDYERMVLEAFPQIFKVKCLMHTGPDSWEESGSITLIVISDLRNTESSKPYQPGATRLLMEDVQAFVQKYISPFVKVFVELPLYESLLIDAKIGFLPGFDPGFYSDRLNEELKQFLSPWAFDDGVDIEIGGAVYKSSILKFMESRPYVDYVVDFKLYHRHGGFPEFGISDMEIDLDFEIASPVYPGIDTMVLGQNFVVGSDTSVACATTAKSILVTAEDHRISALRPDEYVCAGASSLGIGFMTVNLDLIVTE